MLIGAKHMLIDAPLLLLAKQLPDLLCTMCHQ
jgi:hypothetical protein